MSPSREGQSAGRFSRRFCRRCGTTVKHVRIMSALNLCERCAKELSAARGGLWACKGCGKVAPNQLEKREGYCKDCTCPACGRPDPQNVRLTGLCSQCLGAVGSVCRRCGKEAANQVRRNRGFCDDCATARMGS